MKRETLIQIGSIIVGAIILTLYNIYSNDISVIGEWFLYIVIISMVTSILYKYLKEKPGLFVYMSIAHIILYTIYNYTVGMYIATWSSTQTLRTYSEFPRPMLIWFTLGIYVIINSIAYLYYKEDEKKHNQKVIFSFLILTILLQVIMALLGVIVIPSV